MFIDVLEARALATKGAAVVDARGKGPFDEAHLPGAGWLDWTGLRDGLLRTGLLSSDDAELAQAIRAAGVRDGAPVVVYGAGRDGWGEAGRIFWMLEYLGHADVHVLDGGISAWTAAGGATVRGSQLPPPGDFTPRRVESRRALVDELESDLAGGGPTVVWDAREAREYAGATPFGEPRGGHIPGAIGLWYGDLTDARGRLLPEAELRAKLRAAGITPNVRVVALCTGGVRSGFAYAVLRQLGYPDVANYDGSMWQWSADAARPLTREP